MKVFCLKSSTVVPVKVPVVPIDSPLCDKPCRFGVSLEGGHICVPDRLITAEVVLHLMIVVTLGMGIMMMLMMIIFSSSRIVHVIAYAFDIFLRNASISYVMLMYPTPLYSHAGHGPFSEVYEPAEDSFLLIDTLEKDADLLRRRQWVLRFCFLLYYM